MMQQPFEKLLIGAVKSKKFKKISELMLKLFFLPKKVAKIKPAEKFFGHPTV
jgi:hypothetical protein